MTIFFMKCKTEIVLRNSFINANVAIDVVLAKAVVTLFSCAPTCLRVGLCRSQRCLSTELYTTEDLSVTNVLGISPKRGVNLCKPQNLYS